MRAIILFLLLLPVGCASLPGKRVKALPEPVMQPVKVVNKTITGKDVDNVIENQINLWRYIQELKKLGGID
jgi:hypothetical protein